MKTASSPIKVCSAACTSSLQVLKLPLVAAALQSQSQTESQTTLLNLAPCPKRTAPSQTQRGHIRSARERDKAEEDSYRHRLSLEIIRKQSRGALVTALSLFQM